MLLATSSKWWDLANFIMQHFSTYNKQENLAVVQRYSTLILMNRENSELQFALNLREVPNWYIVTANIFKSSMVKL